jgi:hypothetical protein
MDQLFANKTFTTIFVVVTTVFAAHIAPTLPKKVLKLFNADIVKILFMGFIAYSATKNMAIGLTTAILLIILMQSLRSIENKDRIINKITESSQPTSDAKIRMINGMLESTQISGEQKSGLLNSIMQSAASDKHKFNSGMIVINSEPGKTMEVIDKLYSNVKDNKNKINMTHRLIGENSLKSTHVLKIVKYVLKSSIEEEAKAVTIIKVLKDNIPPTLKIAAIKKVKKSKLSNETKNMIFGHLEQKPTFEKFEQGNNVQMLDKVINWIETNQ